MVVGAEVAVLLLMSGLWRFAIDTIVVARGALSRWMTSTAVRSC